MNILFISLSRINSFKDTGIYMDLMKEFQTHGHEVYMICPNERQFNQSTTEIVDNNFHLLKVKTLNYQKTNFIEKGMFMLSSNFIFNKAISKYWGNVSFDLILYATPPISIGGLVKKLKKMHQCTTYLMLKDIDPQGIVDLGVFNSNSIIYKFFRRQEEILYNVSDCIGCMSPANVRYVLEHNPMIKNEQVEICPNSIKLSYVERMSDSKRKCKAIRMKYNVPIDKTVFIYGGNLGMPQGLEFLPIILQNNEKRQDVFFLIVGNGTQYNALKSWFNANQPKNSMLLKGLSKDDYDNLVAACDVGLIFLDPRFTIPNYPSRLLSYMQNKMPVICSTDKNTDVGTIAEKNGYGYSCINGDIESFDSFVEKLRDNHLREMMGNKGFEFLLDNYTVEITYKIIMSHF